MPRTLALIGAPSSAGAHYPGQEKAPQYLRAAGLIAELEAAGLSVIDYGDLPESRCAVMRGPRSAASVAAVVEVAQQLAERVAAALEQNHTPLVVGGDCSIALGVISGFVRHTEDLALLYMDGGVDITTPATYRIGALDSMGLAHMVAEEGAIDSLSRIGPRYPLLPGTKILPFGYIPGEPREQEAAILARHGIQGFPVEAVHGNAQAAASEACRRLEAMAAQFVIHFDVDVIDFVDFPIADVLQPQQGLTLAEAIEALQIFVASPRFAGLVITEFNPDHADAEGELAAVFIKNLAQALSKIDQN
ncbi:MAG TPA: arginase family protein [Herpetosiphonaceae bacterium]